MIETETDVLWSPSQVAASLPGNPGRPTHRNTVRRWIERGIVIRGERIRLLAERRGGRWLIRPADVTEFLTRCQRAGTSADAAEMDRVLQARAARVAERTRRIRTRLAMDRIRAMGVDV